MKILKYMIAATVIGAAPYGAAAQTAAQTTQPAPDAAPADAPSAQTVKPMAGDNIYDKNAEQIGTVASTNGQQVIVTTTKGKITIPLASLFAGTKGLAINMTKEEVDAAIQSAARQGA